MRARPLIGLGLVLVLAACASDTGEGSPARMPSSPELPTAGAPLGVPAAMLDSVVEVAARDTGIAADEIRVVTADAVTWSDGSLGCPEDGQMYTQALVPGYRVVIEAAGEELSYHASESGDFRACANPIAPVEDGRVDR